MKWLVWVGFLVAAGIGAIFVVSQRGDAPKPAPPPPPKPPEPKPEPKAEPEAAAPADSTDDDPTDDAPTDEPTDPGPAPSKVEEITDPGPAADAKTDESDITQPGPAPAEPDPAPEPEAAPAPAPAAKEEVEDEDTSDDNTADQDGGTGRDTVEDTGDAATVDEDEDEEIDATFKMEAVSVKGVEFDGLASMRALSLLNNSDEDALKAVGLKGRPLKLILENRPFQSLVDVGAVKGMGTKTLETIHKATE